MLYTGQDCVVVRAVQRGVYTVYTGHSRGACACAVECVCCILATLSWCVCSAVCMLYAVYILATVVVRAVRVCSNQWTAEVRAVPVVDMSATCRS
jgi:hypothetical protein